MFLVYVVGGCNAGVRVQVALPSSALQGSDLPNVLERSAKSVKGYEEEFCCYISCESPTYL